MKVGIIVPNHQIFETNRCYTNIAIGLKKHGVDVALISTQQVTVGSDFPKEIEVLGLESIDDLKKITPYYDGFVIYTWFVRYINPYLRVISASGKPVFIKADHDGKVKVSPDLLHASTVYNIFHSAKGFKLFSSFRSLTASLVSFMPVAVKKRIFYFKDLLEQFKLADGIIIESPYAARNIAKAMYKLGYFEGMKKIFIIPNPVSDTFWIKETENIKENLIIAVGRWDDEAQKNPRMLVKTLVNFLIKNNNWKAVIIGPGEENLKRYLLKFSKDKNTFERIKILGKLPNSEISNYMKKSKIYISTSRWEGFSLAALEALAAGCTIVALPLESFEYLTYQGFSGTLAKSMSYSDILTALLFESVLWEQGKRSSKSIIEFWRQNISTDVVGEKFLQMLEFASRNKK